MVAQELEQTRAAWDAIAAGYDVYVTPTHFWLGGEGVRRAGVRPGTRFLDVAAGSGALGIPAARAGARVLATDASPVMLARLAARARREGLADLETRVMDGHALDLADATFDVAGSQFGVMLFPDMPRALRELARVVRPGGKALMSVYGPPEQVEFFAFFLAAVRSAVPGFTGPPMDPPPLPFQLQDPGRLREEMTRAGLGDVRVETITETLRFGSGDDLWNWLVNSNPIAGQVIADVTTEQRAAARMALDGMLRERAGGDGPAALTNPVHIGVGTK